MHCPSTRYIFTRKVSPLVQFHDTNKEQVMIKANEILQKIRFYARINLQKY